MSERIYVRKLEHNLWQWRHVTSLGQWASESFYTGDINLLAESISGKQVVLLLPGQHAVSLHEDTDLKDKKLISKVIPFQVEEHIIDSLDELVFAYSPVKDGGLTVCYVNEDFARGAIDELEAKGGLVQRVLVDYLEISREEGAFTLILEHDQLILADDQGGGFCVELGLAPLVLKSVFAERSLPRLVLVAEGEAELAQLKAMLPQAILAIDVDSGATPSATEIESRDEDDLDAPPATVSARITEEFGGFWDYVLVQAKPAIDFRQGPLARKLPFAQWFKEWRIPAAAAVVAFGLAMLAATLDLTTSRKQFRQYLAERDGFYRQIIPGQGSVVDPVKTLKAKLGGGSQAPGSNLVGVLNNVAPAISAHKDVKVSSFRYTHENRELQLNIEARDIATLEAVRNQIGQTGLKAEIKRASVAGDVNQALMRITEG